MADQLFPVSYSLGLDEKTDSKSIASGKLLVAENAVFTKPGLLQKRNGLDSLGKVVDPTGETIVDGEALQSFENQLLLFNGTKAFSYSEANSKWTAKGNVSSVINSTSQIVRNGAQQSNGDGAKVGGFECYAWEDTDGGIHYSIQDSVTENFLVSNQLLTLYGSKPKVLWLNPTSTIPGQFIIVYVQFTSILIARIPIDSPTLSPLLQTVTTVLHENQVFDACVSQALELTNGVQTTEFNNIWISYACRINSSNVCLTPKVVQVSPTSYTNYSTFADTATDGEPQQLSMCASTDMSSQAVAVAGPTAIILWHSSSQGFKVAKINGVAQLTPVSIPLPTNFEYSALSRISIALSEAQLVDKVLTKVVFEFQKTPSFYSYIKIADFSVQVAGTVVSASQFTNIKTKKSVGLYSKSFLNNSTLYLTSTHESYLQSTYFILNSSLEVVSKLNVNNGGGLRGQGLSEVIQDGYTYSIPVSNTFSSTQITHLIPSGNGIYHIPTQKKGKIESENNTVFSKLGLVKSTLDFKNPNHFLGATLNDNLYTVGGILQNYDGNKFTEAGFNLYPEGLGPNHGPLLDNSQFYVNTTQFGSSTLPQEMEITCIAGNRITPGDVFQINSGGNLRGYYIYFTVDGIGSDPVVPGLTPLEVPINSYYTSAQVAFSMAAVLNLVGDFTAVAYSFVLFVQNAQNGLTVPPAAISAGVGNIAAGTYNYLVIWKYIDNKGRIYPSATSISESITTTFTDSSVTVTVPILGLTTKDKVIMEVYRTQTLSTLFRRCSSTINPTFNISSDDYHYTSVSFTDTLSDADLASNELVYTTGDVLDNDAFPACSLITSYDSRIWLAGLEDKNSLVYTKIIDPLNKDMVGGFSEAFEIDFLPQGGDITAIAKMDEKLIIFKQKEIYYISGVGPSNANDSNNYNSPQLVSSDVGCNNPNSVVLMPTGLMFKTDKGIYKLDQSLAVSYVGAPVEAHNYLTISSAILISNKNQVRFTTEESVCLVFDYVFMQWTTFTNYASTDSDIFQNKHVVLSQQGLTRIENNSFIDNGVYPISMAFETGNINLANLQGYQRFKRMLLLGEYLGGHSLKVSFAYNFSPVFTESTVFNMNTQDTESSSTGVYANYSYGDVGPFGVSDGYVFGGVYRPYQFRVFPNLQKCTSFRIRVEDDQTALATSQINEGYNISNISITVGIKSGQNKVDSLHSQGTS